MRSRVSISRRIPGLWLLATRLLVPVCGLIAVPHTTFGLVVAVLVVGVSFLGFDRLLFWAARSKARELVLRAARRAGLHWIRDGGRTVEGYAVPASASAMAASRSL